MKLELELVDPKDVFAAYRSSLQLSDEQPNPDDVKSSQTYI